MSTHTDPQKYHGMKYRIYFAGLFLDAVLLAVLLFGGLSLALRDYATGMIAHPWGAGALYILLLAALFSVLHFPLRVFLGYYWEHLFGLSKQSFSQWLTDELKKGVLSLGLSLVLAAVMYSLLEHAAQTWWIYTGLFWFALSFVLAKLTPTVIVPLFYKYKDIEDSDLRARIKKLFADARVKLGEVYAIDFSRKTVKANAFICGLGGSRRVVLSDTLIDNYSGPEIATVVAHELGHHCHRDILKMMAINSVLIFSGLYIIDRILTHAVSYFGLNGIADIAGLPLLMLVFSVYSLFLTPLLNAVSCRMETAADRYSLERTGDPRAFISVMEKLGRQNLAEFRPDKWIECFFYDHPPLARRIAFAREYRPEGGEGIT